MKKVFKLKECAPLSLKFDLKMKLTTLLMIVALFQLQANEAYSQKTKITLDLENVSVENVLDKIESLTEFKFFYFDNEINYKKKVSLKVKKEPISKILKKLFANSNIEFVVLDKQITLRVKKTTLEDFKSSELSITKENKQEVNITGTVTDTNGQPLPGTNIIEKGTTNGVQTDFDGNFSITVSDADVTLVFSYIGFKTKELALNGATTINVVLEESTDALDEVVVIGYGTTTKKDLTGSVASIKGDALINRGSGSVEDALYGQLAGVSLSGSDNAPGAGVDIVIRGASSINASSSPLYVIDGFPFEGTFSSAGGNESTPQSPLAAINPNDIESVDVLKDASATAIYGARGANGVIIITTKSGKSGKTKVNLDISTTLSNIIPVYEVYDTQGWAQRNFNILFPYPDRVTLPVEGEEYFEFVDPSLLDDEPSTDWLDVVTRTALTKNYNVSVSGGNEKGNYLASFGYLNNEGVIKETDFERFTSNLKLNGTVTDKLKLSFNTRISTSTNNGTNTLNSGGAVASLGVLQSAITTSPLRTIDDVSEDVDFLGGTDFIIGNPLNNLEEVDQIRENVDITSNISATLKIAENFEFISLFGIRATKDKFSFFAPSTTSLGRNDNGVATLRDTENNSWLNENTLSYKNNFGEHNINILVGTGLQKTTTATRSVTSRDFAIQNLGFNDISAGQDPALPTSSATEFSLASTFGRLSYDYKGKYLLNGTLRSDGSSKFAEGRKWGVFPSFSAAWKVTEEGFAKNWNAIDQLKFRGGWGQTGNPNILPYQSLTNFGIVQYISGTSIVTGVAPVNIGNESLTWEISEQSNIGIDLTMFKGRLSLVADAYIKSTKDLLLNAEIPPTLGFDRFLYNSGEIQNKGLEFALSGILMDRKDFQWNANFNIAFNENKVISLGDLATSDQIDVPGTGQSNTAVLREGEPIGLWWGLQSDGLWTQDDFTWNAATQTYDLNDVNGQQPAVLGNAQPGVRRYKDISGPDGNPDGLINEFDRTIIGRSQPKFVGGFTSQINYKNFDFGINLEFSYGRDVYNQNYLQTAERAPLGGNNLVLDYYLPVQYGLNSDGTENRDIILDPGNPDGEFPILGSGDPFQAMNDAYIEDGSYLRARNISLGYTFKDSLLKVPGESIRIYISVQNAFTITNYSGYDPNVNAQSLGGLRPGLDQGAYPLSRGFTFGINASF